MRKEVEWLGWELFGRGGSVMGKGCTGRSRSDAVAATAYRPLRKVEITTPQFLLAVSAGESN